MVLAFVTISATFGNSVLRGITSLALGLVLGLVGIDKLTGQSRLAYGVPSLLDGISITTLAVGLFAMGETLYVASRFTGVQETIEAVRGSLWMTRGRLAALVEAVAARHRPRLSDRCAAGRRRRGADAALVHARAQARREAESEFGKGAIEGVAGPEAANNAAATGTLVPLLALGLPTSATAAMMLAGFQQYGLVPGPLLFVNQRRPGLGPDRELLHRQPDAAGAEPAAGRPVGEAAAGAAAVALRRHPACSRRWARWRRTRRPSSSLMLVGFGIVGYLMRCWDYPVAPMIVGLILGPMAESQFRRALQISLGDPLVFFKHPGSATLLALAVAALVAPLAFKGLRKFKGEDA